MDDIFQYSFAPWITVQLDYIVNSIASNQKNKIVLQKKTKKLVWESKTIALKYGRYPILKGPAYKDAVI